MGSGWIGLRSRAEQCFAGTGLSVPEAGPDPDSLLATGTLVIEGAFLRGPAPQNLLRYSTRDPWMAGLTLLLDTDGTLRLLMRQGERTLSAAVDSGLGDTPETARISYAWDAPARSGRLTVWRPERGGFTHTHVTGPLPLTLRDGYRIASDSVRVQLSAQVEHAALSDRAEPAGPLPGIGAGAFVATTDGLRPIEAVRAGDLVLTADGDTAQVRWTGAVTVPARGRQAPLLMRAPYHGLNSDLVIAPDQRIAVAGSEIEYLFGEERVAVAARHLLGRHSTEALRGAGPLVTYHQLLLDRHAVMVINGAPVESLDAQAVLNDPSALPASILAGMPAELRPMDTRLALPVLQGYEAVTLQSIALG